MAAELRLHLSHLKQLVTCSLCHGLLKQATCLCCNHHFCMACILDFTTKITGSCCPKCSLPATKQQAKYSPEFDKLVTVYQSLEIASADLQPCFSERTHEENNAGSGEHNLEGQKKRKRFNKKHPNSPGECLPCPAQLESQHCGDGSWDLEENGKKMAPYRGHLPMSKRVQLPSPSSKETTGHEEILPLLETKSSSISADVANTGVDSSTRVFEKTQEILGQLEELNMRENPGAEKTKEQLCLSFKDAKGGLVIGSVVSVMVKPYDASSVLDGHGDDTDSQQLKSQVLTSSPKSSTKCRPIQNNFALDQVCCAFCQTPNDSLTAGPMLHYEKGVPVKAGRRIKSLLSVHQYCAEWAPNVYYVGDVAKNLLKEVARGQKLKCSCCGMKGAVLGCLVKRCVKSFHYPCARTLPCRWDDENFLVLCPEHVGSNLPGDELKVKQEKIETEFDPASGTHARTERDESNGSENMNPLKSLALHSEGCKSARAHEQVLAAEPKRAEDVTSYKWSLGATCNWVLCGSGLSSKAYELLSSVVQHTGAKFTRAWEPCVTHLITGTDENGAASRTLKFLLATLAGTWILRSEWLEACLEACQPVSEEQFEVSLDIHGMVGGPKRARLLAASRTRDLFEDLEFYLCGNYATAYKEDLQALIKAAGGRLLSVLDNGTDAREGQSFKVVVYSAGMLPQGCVCQEEVLRSRWLEAKAVASEVRALVVRHTWILDSIAACELQPFN